MKPLPMWLLPGPVLLVITLLLVACGSDATGSNIAASSGLSPGSEPAVAAKNLGRGYHLPLQIVRGVYSERSPRAQMPY